VKRIAFIMQGNAGTWLGGVNYIRNLFIAIHSNQDRYIEPVLFVSPELDQTSLSGFSSSTEVVRTSLASSKHYLRLIGRLFYSLSKRDPVLEILLKKHRIDALSHSYELGMNSDIVSIGWIPDFQHIHLPQFFKRKALQRRDRRFRQMIGGCQRIILSSYDAKKDFEIFAPGAINKSRVLQFVSCSNMYLSSTDYERLCIKYNIESDYFLLPNQFWAHKNHAVVIEALSILKKRGTNIVVLATGDNSDYRNPTHFSKLISRAKYLGVEKNFRVMGVVPSEDLQSLMLNAVAVINPSYFEGWSTTVEEAKSLGLSILLSNIPVHIEQAPPFGRYFKVDSPEDLADKIYSAMNDYDPLLASQLREAATKSLPGRIRRFGKAYEEIVLDAISQQRQ